MNNQPSVTNDKFCDFPRITIHLPDRRPSWKRYGSGTQWMVIYASPRELSFDATESCDTSSKRVMISLPIEQARALRDFLNTHVKD